MKLTSPEIITGSYKYVCVDGKLTTEHRAKMTRISPRDNANELVIHHIDGDKGNNNIDNLAWMTPREHLQLHKKGVRRPGFSGAKNPNYKTGEWADKKRPKDYTKERNKKYYQANKERLLVKQNAYALLHREHKRIYDKVRYWDAALEKAKTEERRQECLTRLAELKEVIS